MTSTAAVTSALVKLKFNWKKKARFMQNLSDAECRLAVQSAANYVSAIPAKSS